MGRVRTAMQIPWVGVHALTVPTYCGRIEQRYATNISGLITCNNGAYTENDIKQESQEKVDLY